MKIGLGVIISIFLGVMIFVVRPVGVFLRGGSSWAQDDTVKTLTRLPALPGISIWSGMVKSKEEIMRERVDVKLSTYPDKPSTPYRVAKHRPVS